MFETGEEITIVVLVRAAFTPGLRFIGGIATLACLCWLGWFSANHRQPRSKPPTLASHVPPSDPLGWENWLASLAKREESRDLLLESSDGFLAMPRAQLGFSLDRTQLAAELTRTSQPIPLGERVLNALGLSNDPTVLSLDVPLIWSLDRHEARAALEKVSASLAVAPQNARLDFARRELEPPVTGRALDVEASLAQLVRLSQGAGDVSPLVFDEREPTVTLADLPPVDPRKLLATFETDFSKKRGPRVHNIRRAAGYLNGSIVHPGATLSFNERVGPRVASRGFVDAPVIINDEMESGLGGGVCQVATTLHAAAVYGGLEIKERRSHSRPSGYAPLGLDATVIDDVQDLKIVNPYTVPLYIRAYLPSKYVIRVEIFGAELEGTVKHSYWVLERHAFTRRIVEKPELAPGTFKVSQKGNFGYDTLSSVIQIRVDGQRKERRFKSKYYPVPEVLWVGPGTRGADLPPLPEAAVASDGAETL